MRARRFQFLIVEDGGRRLRRVNVPLWVARSAIALAGIGVLVLSVVLLDYRALRSARAEIAVHQRDAREHRRVTDLMAERLAALRAEVATWPGLHTTILKPFGPSGRAPTRSGIGGAGLTLAPSRDIIGQASMPEQLQELLASLQEEGNQLRALARFTADAGRVMSALPSRWPLTGARSPS